MDKLLIQEFKKQFPEIRENEPLKKHTSMRVGGPASLFIEAAKPDNLKKIVGLAIEKNTPYLVIGNGTNIIFADAGFDGLVIKNSTSNLIFEQSEAIVDAGMPLQRLLRKLSESDIGGLEFLAGIPGSVGGAVYGNAGAYGRAMADVVRGVIVLDIDGKVIQVGNPEMKFGYRSSFLKRAAKIHDRFKMPVILSVRVQVVSRPKEAILRVVDNYIKIRVKKHPAKPSAGSIFKNLLAKDYPTLAKKIPMVVLEGKIPAAFLIDKADCKGRRIGGAEVSQEHANFIVNTGGAKASDVKRLALQVKNKIKEEFGATLSEEVEFIGDFEKKPIGFFAKIFK